MFNFLFIHLNKFSVHKRIFLFQYYINRYKREVASSLVERGVAERVRLTNNYEKKREELQKQHESVKTALSEHKITVINSVQFIYSFTINLSTESYA